MAMMKKNLFLGMLCGFFALVFTACDFNTPIKEDIDYYLHFAPVESWEEIQTIVDRTSSGGDDHRPFEQYKRGRGAYNHSGGQDHHPYGVPRTGTDSLFTVNGGTLILGDSKSGPLTLDGDGGSITATTPMVLVTVGNFILDGATITNGKTSVSGGGVYVNGGSFTINDGKISLNYASNYGGGVYVNGGSFTMHGGEISDNTAYIGGGGCIKAAAAVSS